MAPILTAEDVVQRIAAECAYVDERGGVGIRLEPAAAIVRRYGEQFRPRRQRRPRPVKPIPPSLNGEWRRVLFARSFWNAKVFERTGSAEPTCRSTALRGQRPTPLSLARGRG